MAIRYIPISATDLKMMDEVVGKACLARNIPTSGTEGTALAARVLRAFKDGTVKREDLTALARKDAAV